MDEDYLPRRTKRDFPRYEKVRGRNSTKPWRLHYDKARREKEMTVKDERFWATQRRPVWRAPSPPAYVGPRPARPARAQRPGPVRATAPSSTSAKRDRDDRGRDSDSDSDGDDDDTASDARGSTPPAPKAKRPDETARAAALASLLQPVPVGAPEADALDREAKAEARRLLDALDGGPGADWPGRLLQALPALLAHPRPGAAAAAAAKPDLFFARAVVSHLPHELLQGLRARMATLPPRSALPAGLGWDDVLGADQILSALLRLQNAQKRALLCAFLAPGPAADAPASSESPLLPVFDETTGDLLPAFRAARLSKAECAHPAVFRTPGPFVDAIRRRPGRRSGQPCLELFRLCLDVFSAGLLRHVDWTHVALVGGAVTACLLPLPPHLVREFVRLRRVQRLLRRLRLPPDVLRLISEYADEPALRAALHQHYHRPHESPLWDADLDLLILARSQPEAEARLAALCAQLLAALPAGTDYRLVRTVNSVTLVTGHPRRHCQMLLSYARDPAEFTLWSDLDCTALAYTAHGAPSGAANALALPRSVRALNTRSSLVPPPLLRSPAERGRIVKYAARGFDAVVFELCKHHPRCDTELDADAQRLMRLVRDRQYRYARRRRAPEASDLAGYTDSKLPYGPTATLADVERYAASAAFSAADRPLVARSLAEALQPVEGGMAGVRPRLQDVLASHRADELVFKCYQCGSRVPHDPARPELLGLGLCAACSALNAEKLAQWDGVRRPGWVACVTGGRVKIGYACALRLLRSGLTVIVVTRFPHDAARRYLAEPDSRAWRERLHIYGLDLRHLPSVQQFVQHLLRRYPRLDVLINNAAQTVRRPAPYYAALCQAERHWACASSPEAAAVRALLRTPGPDPFLLPAAPPAASLPESDRDALALSLPLLGGGVSGGAALSRLALAGMPLSAALTQVALLPEDSEPLPAAAAGACTETGEAVDLRQHTSWTKRVDEISLVESLEVAVVNAQVPFLLLSQLLPLLTSAARNGERAFCVNVTAAEGQFSASKQQGHHVATNMAKASLNMLTRTVAEALAARNVWVSAVDPGWVSAVKPPAIGKWQRRTPPPLSCAQGAARVLDPILLGLSVPVPPHGVLLRNFLPASW